MVVNTNGSYVAARVHGATFMPLFVGLLASKLISLFFFFGYFDPGKNPVSSFATMMSYTQHKTLVRREYGIASFLLRRVVRK